MEPQTLDDVRAASAEARAALDDYLADHGWRVVTQYSPRGVTLIELPKVLLQAIAAAAEGRRSAAARRCRRRARPRAAG